MFDNIQITIDNVFLGLYRKKGPLYIQVDMLKAGEW